MDTKSEDKIRDIIVNDLLSIHNRRVESSKRLNENLEDSLDYLRALSAQLSQPTSGLIVTKTPKLLRKRVIQRIETIPENEVFQQERTSVDSQRSTDHVEEQETSELSNKSKRVASKRAADIIKKQCSLILGAKQKKLSSDDNDSTSTKREKRKGQIKRKKSETSSSDEDDVKSDAKCSKLDADLPETKSLARKTAKKKSGQITRSIEQMTVKSKRSTNVEDTFKSPKLLRSSRPTSRSSSKTPRTAEADKEKNDTIVASNTDDVEELSMYEDAIGKPTPLMNSTLKYSSVSASEKMLNVVVMLEQLPQNRKLNETVVIQKASSARNSRNPKKRSNKALRDSTQTYKEINEQYSDNCNGLITDDESPAEKKLKKQPEKRQDNKIREIKRAKSSSSDDEIPNTPVRERLRDAIVQESKMTYKSNALFSPYAKESVKKRVEAFEQAVMHSPKPVDVDVPMRITRTKTRAMTAAESEVDTKNVDKNVTLILARKSLAKAKKISLAKQKKENVEFKENKEPMPERINKLLLNDKLNNDKATKQTQQQKTTTPLSKMKIMQPLSVNRLHTPLNAQNLVNNAKALTASRANIITSVDSFVPPPKSINKTNSVDKLEEKKRQEEDARKKREEALRLQTEEKRRKRQEKELKNKLAREAKEKQEVEKRQKAEREREEKAKLALLMQEKVREEMEKKRLALLQRAQEKEERRKLEEQQRLRKLQEQEEAERLLAEQKRREQEAEKRKEAEARAQQQAAAEALRQKNQMLAAQAKYKQQINNKHQGATNYILDSEPDDDESDDENRPKHEVPYWAQPHVRKVQLALQRYIPEEIVYKFFDCRKCTPDLTEMFHGIDRTRLKRTSSAIWKTPPRISMMEIE
ncbi:hypothetical protein DMN91_010838 [Ooceraea biroi]|uniref:Inner centromere protein B n=1 Tax=Ooceraea biroi TaxID=2015173 RepID=A0A026WS55_OOCBI|nr:inner centromere protein A [Ooceraea biroi]EZA58880.1 Inner centromere protein B [Ooceraea biroi]RLU16770.1 hypothetical protein DMN91_010838 [Ooceraea biroi]